MAAYTPAVIDGDLYRAERFELVKAQTGIRDPVELKQHILAVQAKAYDLLSYPCIRRFEFATPRISTYSAYTHVLAVGRERPGAILLDVGCCFGTDIRQAASDGFPRQNLIASDLRPEFWDFGHELFRSTPETFPVPFIAGDVLDPEFLEPREPLLTRASEPSATHPALTSLATLTPLHGRHVAAIHISLVFHLFLEPKQLQLARALAGLLSPVPGSVILGSHVGLREKGFREGLCIAGRSMFCHSPQSWREMWETVFPKGSIDVEAELHRRASDTPGAGVLVWSVTRV